MTAGAVDDVVGVMAPKVSLPRVPPFAVGRRRLVARLDGARRADGPNDVVLVCAPLGYGKTTLLSDWAAGLRARGDVVAWVTCDRGDDLRRFWAAVASAIAFGLQRAGSTVGTATADDVDPRRRPEVIRWRELAGPPAQVDDTYVRAVALALDSLDHHVVLVLDDVHDLVDGEVRASLRSLLRLRPAHLTAVLAARAEPALELSRLRLTGDLVELRADDLACTEEETADLLSAFGTSLPPGSVASLRRRTEGWPAGLRLIALALRDHGDLEEVVDRVVGDHGVVADYLVESLLNQMPPPDRRVLRLTSVVAAVTGDLAVALTGDEGAGATLERLEGEGALLTRLGRWYHLHSLLREHLLADLRLHEPGAVGPLHATAARWHLQHGHRAAALEHVVQCDDAGTVADVVAAAGPTMVLEGASATVLRLLAAAPPVVRRDPAVSAVLALARLEDPGATGPAGHDLTGTAAAATTAAATTRVGTTSATGASSEGLPADKAGLVALAARLRSLRASGRFDVVDVAAGTAALDLVREVEVEALLLQSVAPMTAAVGDTTRAAQLYGRARELADRHGFHQLNLEAAGGLATTALATGDLAEVRSQAQDALDVADRRGWGGSGAALPARAARAVADALAGARTAEEEPGGLAGHAGAPDPETDLLVLTAGALRGRPPGGRDPVDAAASWWDEHGATRVAPWLVAVSAWSQVVAQLRRGRPSAALAVLTGARARGLPSADEDVLHAAVHLAAGRAHEAEEVVEHLVEGGGDASAGHPLLAVAGCVTYAVAAAERGRVAAADRAVLRALSVTAGTGIVLPFLDDPRAEQLLRDVQGRAGTLEPTVAEVLSVLSPTAGPHPPHSAGTDLTPRELDLLRELPSLLRLSEIADRHQVSRNTVKTHVRSLYRKLGVADRRAAVEAARRLGLL